MGRASFAQADIERIIRAAKKSGAIVKVDLRSLEVTIYPNPISNVNDDPDLSGFKPDGKERFDRENWDDEPSTDRRRGPRTFISPNLGDFQSG